MVLLKYISVLSYFLYRTIDWGNKMEQEILENLRLDIEDVKEIIRSNFEEMQELEKNPKVKRYIHLLHLKEELENGLSLNNDKEIAIHELGKYTQGVIQETNDIWFLIGKYTLEEYLDTFGTTPSIKDNFLLYVNLENEKMHNCIMPSSQLDFESEHTVIKTNKKNDWQGYYKMRNKFFVDCVKEGETTAYQKVLTKTNG